MRKGFTWIYNIGFVGGLSVGYIGGIFKHPYWAIGVILTGALLSVVVEDHFCTKENL